MSHTITLRLPTALVQWLEEESRVTGLPEGRIVQEQLEQLRTKKHDSSFSIWQEVSKASSAVHFSF